MATEKPADSRTDMLTAYLKIEPLELTRLLAPAGLPPKESLPRGYIPAKKELDLIIQSYFDLLIRTSTTPGLTPWTKPAAACCHCPATRNTGAAWEN